MGLLAKGIKRRVAKVASEFAPVVAELKQEFELDQAIADPAERYLAYDALSIKGAERAAPFLIAIVKDVYPGDFSWTFLMTRYERKLIDELAITLIFKDWTQLITNIEEAKKELVENHLASMATSAHFETLIRKVPDIGTAFALAKAKEEREKSAPTILVTKTKPKPEQ